MRTIAITNQKGGSGKTTAAVNLAAALGEKGHRSLVIDLDPQANASTWLLGQEAEDRGLLQVLTDNRALVDQVQATPAPGVEAVASSPAFAGVETALAGKMGAEQRLRRAIEQLPSDRWEFVFLDCPPSTGLLSVSALAAASEVLIPLEAHAMSLSGLTQLLHSVEEAKELLHNPNLDLIGVLISRMHSRARLAQDVDKELRGNLGPLVFKTVIRENIRLAEAPSYGKPITLYAPSSPGAEDYRAAAKELLNRRVKA